MDIGLVVVTWLGIGFAIVGGVLGVCGLAALFLGGMCEDEEDEARARECEEMASGLNHGNEETLSMATKEEAYQSHRVREARGCDADEHLHPDGCFYCGGDHPSDSCPHDDTVDEHWDD